MSNLKYPITMVDVFIAGPTGSGKTVLYELLKKLLAKEGLKVIKMDDAGQHLKITGEH